MTRLVHLEALSRHTGRRRECPSSKRGTKAARVWGWSGNNAEVRTTRSGLSRLTSVSVDGHKLLLHSCLSWPARRTSIMSNWFSGHMRHQRIPRNRRLLCEMPCARLSQGRFLVGWTHSLAPTLSDRFHHSLWRLRSGCRNRVGGSHFPPLERLPERGSEVATCTPCARIKPRNTAFKAPGQVGLRFTGPPACGHPGGEPQGDLWSRKNAARAFTPTATPLHI